MSTLAWPSLYKLEKNLHIYDNVIYHSSIKTKGFVYDLCMIICGFRWLYFVEITAVLSSCVACTHTPLPSPHPTHHNPAEYHTVIVQLKFHWAFWEFLFLFNTFICLLNFLISQNLVGIPMILKSREQYSATINNLCFFFLK